MNFYMETPVSQIIDNATVVTLEYTKKTGPIENLTDVTMEYTRKTVPGESLTDVALYRMPSLIIHRANRVWAEDASGVRYVKNRSSSNDVDMSEFIWVKLRAQDIK